MVNFKERLEKATGKAAQYGKKFVVPVTFEEFEQIVNMYVQFRKSFDDLTVELVKNKEMYFHNEASPVIRYKGQDFIFSFSNPFYIWDITGTNAIYCGNDLVEAKKKLDLWIDGLQECSDHNCHNVFTPKDMGGKFYAGTYCKDCWESKYKYIEARENYD